MIYAIGLNSDRTINHFVRQALALGIGITYIDLYTTCTKPWCFTIPTHEYCSQILTEDKSLLLDPTAGYYVRLVDLSSVTPEPFCNIYRSLVSAIASYLETIPGKVINRPGAHAHNGAKPFHELWLSQQGFLVPPSITTSDKNYIAKFLSIHQKAIVKALCGTRGSTQAVTLSDFESFESQQGPVHLQKYVNGFDMRIHVIKDQIHAEKIVSDSVDYRETNAESVHSPTTIPYKLAQQIISASKKMGLVFTGWDFKVDEDGNYWCLEANPMPGYDGYDKRANGKISASLVRYLQP